MDKSRSNHKELLSVIYHCMIHTGLEEAWSMKWRPVRNSLSKSSNKTSKSGTKFWKTRSWICSISIRNLRTKWAGNRSSKKRLLSAWKIGSSRKTSFLCRSTRGTPRLWTGKKSWMRIWGARWCQSNRKPSSRCSELLRLGSRNCKTCSWTGNQK